MIDDQLALGMEEDDGQSFDEWFKSLPPFAGDATPSASCDQESAET